MRLSSDPADLQQIGNVPWKKWHAHLYTCRPCQRAKRCAEGQELLTAAETQAPITREAIDRPAAED